MENAKRRFRRFARLIRSVGFSLWLLHITKTSNHWHNSTMIRPSAGRVLPVALGFLLSACAAEPPTPIASQVPTHRIEPSASFSPAFTPSPSPTSTEASTAADAPAVTQTPTPSRTKSSREYIFPVQPQGAADFAAGGHAYPATDIFAPVGTGFVAVTDGVVDFVSYEDQWDPATDDPAAAGGLCVAIIGDDGIRYYGSHLSEIVKGIQRGLRVKAGQLLGRVGKSGNARNTESHLHFGISHPTYPEDWETRRGELDPYPYLVAWSRGENVTPVFPTPAA
jgi:murein DD-endopeptidase MepM/ murein hydrolase activator NlpD